MIVSLVVCLTEYQCNWLSEWRCGDE